MAEKHAVQLSTDDGVTGTYHEHRPLDGARDRMELIDIHGRCRCGRNGGVIVPALRFSFRQGYLFKQ